MKKYCKIRARLRRSYLGSILEYNDSTGIFTWRETRGCVKVGSTAGSLAPNGYVSIMIDGLAYGAHRLAWLYMHWAHPTEEIDHINGVRHDNRIANLRLATCAENCRNAKVKSNSKTGVKGVHLIAGKYVARIKHKSGNLYIGRFDTLGQAATAYDEAASKKYGKFAWLNNG